MTGIQEKSETHSKIEEDVFDYFSKLCECALNEPVQDIFAPYAHINTEFTRVKITSIDYSRFEKKTKSKIYDVYVTLYLMNKSCMKRADVLYQFVRSKEWEEMNENRRLKLDSVSRIRNASRDLLRGEVEERASFSLAFIYSDPADKGRIC